jgi:hypothetical protein
MQDKLQKIYWKQIAGNPYIVPLDIRMFLVEGYQRHMKCYLKGDSVKLMAPTLRIVTFDIDFVTAKIEKMLLSPTGMESMEKFQELVELAQYNKRQKLAANRVLVPLQEKHYIPEFCLVE